MNAAVYTVRLPRLRRLRPPSNWRVYLTLQMIVVLGFIAHAVVKVAAGNPLWILNATLWSLSYMAEKRHYQQIQHLESSDALLPPIGRWRWMWLVWLVVFQAYEWSIL